MPDMDQEPEKQPKPETAEGEGAGPPGGESKEKKAAGHPPKAPSAKHRAGDRTKKRKKTPKGLILGFVIGGLAIVAAILVLASSGGLPKEEVEAAKTAFRSLMGDCLEGRTEAGIPRLHVHMLLRYEKPDEFGKWKDLTAEQRTALGPVAFDVVRERLGRMGVKDAASADALLASAQVKPDSRTAQVQYEMKAGDVSWNATLQKVDAGWQLIRLEPIR